jgi:hypothetical protein
VTETLAAALLRYAAAGPAPELVDRIFRRAKEGSPDELRWLAAAGLAPLLHRALESRLDRLPGPVQSAILSADLTAQVRHAQLVETACEVVDLCNDLEISATLLKGISIGEECYPAAHLRPMSDVDILVPGESVARLESELLGRGYRRHPDFPAKPGLRHDLPLLHPGRQTWVEIHQALYPNNDSLRDGTLFGANRILAHSVDSTFHGRSVRRLSAEFQLAYIASSWVLDITLRKIHPSFVVGLFDGVYLFRKHGASFDWDGLVDSLDNEMAAASLLVMLEYFQRRDIVRTPATRRSSVSARQELVGRVQLGLIHFVLDRYLLGGRTWNLALPLPVPGRYSVRHQARKRLLTKLTARARDKT